MRGTAAWHRRRRLVGGPSDLVRVKTRPRPQRSLSSAASTVWRLAGHRRPGVSVGLVAAEVRRMTRLVVATAALSKLTSGEDGEVVLDLPIDFGEVAADVESGAVVVERPHAQWGVDTRREGLNGAGGLVDCGEFVPVLAGE